MNTLPADPIAGSISGFVLAGGRSSRMGSDKALALFAGAPLIEVALAKFAAAGVSARIAGSRSTLGAFAEEIADTLAETGPLGGIHAALSASTAEWNLFLPVDMPLMPASLLALLVRRAAITGAPVTATRLNGRLEPFPVVLHGSVLLLITRRLEAGDGSCSRAWQTIPEELAGLRDEFDELDELDEPNIENLLQCGQCGHPGALPPALWYRSANTPAELKQLNWIYTRRLEAKRPDEKLYAPIDGSLK